MIQKRSDLTQENGKSSQRLQMCTKPRKNLSDLEQEGQMNAEDDAYERPIAPIYYLISEYLEKLLLFNMYLEKVRKYSFPYIHSKLNKQKQVYY